MNPYQKSKEQGYSDSEILEFLSTHPKYSEKLKKSRDSGYSDDDIISFLSGGDEEEEPERTFLEKSGRVGTQFALGAAERALFPYEMAVAPLGMEGGQEAMGDLFTRDIMSDTYLPEERQFEHLDPRELKKPIDISVRGLTEKATGLDLQPEGVLEKAAHWSAFLKDPKKLKDLATFGLKPKEAIKAVLPTAHEAFRGLGAGTAMEMAELGHFGPLGHLVAAVVGDVIGHGPKQVYKAIKEPRKTLAQAVNLFTGGNSKKAWANELINQARESGIQLDAGTITGSPFLQWLQARAAQSGLSGKALDEFRKDLSGQILREYNGIADQVGNMTFENSHQAAEAIKTSLKVQENGLLKYLPPESPQARSLQGRIATEAQPQVENELFLNRIAPQEFANDYTAGETLKTVAEDIKTPIKEQFNERWTRFDQRVMEVPPSPQIQLAQDMRTFIAENEGSLLLGESSAEHRVVTAAQRLLARLAREDGSAMNVTLNDLIKTKRTLQDIADYEFGGSNFQSKYKKIVEDIDNAITRTLNRQSPVLLEEFRALNGDYRQFKETFENKNVLPLFEEQNHNYSTIYNGYVTNPDKLRSLEDLMFNVPRGEEILNQVKRDYANRVISQRNVTDRDIRNLGQALGPQFTQDLGEYWQARQFLEANPNLRAATRPRIGMEVPLTQKQASQGRTLSVKPADIHRRQKMYEFLKGKSSEQIMKMFDTIEGIRKIKSVLNLTEEGKQLFKDLSRFKLSEMIDKNMKNNMTEQVKLGTFSNLLKTTKNKAIVKELLGDESFKRLVRLQKNAGKLAESASKFFNASQSGTTLTDVSLVSAAMVGVFTGNAYMAVPAIAKVGGMRVIANLFADREFLKILEEVILSPKALKTPLNVEESLLRMRPYIEQAMLEAKNYNESQSDFLNAE